MIVQKLRIPENLKNCKKNIKIKKSQNLKSEFFIDKISKLELSKSLIT